MRKLAVCLIGMGLILTGCPKAKDETKKTIPDYLQVPGDDEALIYNLVGRWYPKDEIKRLSAVSMTPTAWCKTEHTRIRIRTDEAEIHCAEQRPHLAKIAKIERTKDGFIKLIMRAEADAELKSLTFHKAKGTDAEISGSPCFKNEVKKYSRFPEYENLKSEILGGRQCSQILSISAVKP